MGRTEDKCIWVLNIYYDEAHKQHFKISFPHFTHTCEVGWVDYPAAPPQPGG